MCQTRWGLGLSYLQSAIFSQGATRKVEFSASNCLANQSHNLARGLSYGSICMSEVSNIFTPQCLFNIFLSKAVDCYTPIQKFITKRLESFCSQYFVLWKSFWMVSKRKNSHAPGMHTRPTPSAEERERAVCIITGMYSILSEQRRQGAAILIHWVLNSSHTRLFTTNALCLPFK